MEERVPGGPYPTGLPQRSTFPHRLLSAAAFALLIATHLDVWRPQREVLWFGWLPEELGWRLAWMTAAALYVLHFTRFVWVPRPEDADEETRP